MPWWRTEQGGFVPVNDQGDAYKLLYPFGWQVIFLETQPFTVCCVPSNSLWIIYINELGRPDEHACANTWPGRKATDRDQQVFTKYAMFINCSTARCCAWQEVSVGGQDVVYKDIIEPLESVSVSITPSDKDDITLYGEPVDVSMLQQGPICIKQADAVHTVMLTNMSWQSVSEKTIALPSQAA